ncbi:hypothetical protein GCM10025864_28650 [Luteimicrobium album]|uniref:Acyltransferase 3 domain-containing protein n=1 Tax=Luteimicrobium album TaxID=1054550 RepID=A0ABQ6I2Y9_9MICO|nr:acyltransferase [Luteimicrobium album]GMA25106.1 hypothetical protein GCM10025864_28650 [Luteimicrobium album]
MSVVDDSEAAPRTAAADVAPRSTTRQRADIQALRALAVTLVVLFHFWPGRMPGGYIGVDVFFVISGFLITSHLLREVDRTGSIALGRFWARRARRLLPAAYLVIAACVVVTLVAIPHTDWQQWFREFTGATLYVENWVLAADAVDYLAADNAPSPVQHYWSLSAEEQFYLVWPLLVLGAAFLARRGLLGRRRLVALVLGVATVASFVYSLRATTHDPSAAYFVTPARAWQFGAGALLAVWAGRTRHNLPSVPAAFRALAAWAGYALILLGGFALFDSSTPFPGTAALVPVVATMAVIWADEPDHRLAPNALARRRPVGYLGDISYSLYLWHWPPLIIIPVLLGHELGLAERLILLITVVLVAAGSKRYIEDRTRFSHRFGLQRTGVALGATAVVAALLAGTSLAGTATVDRETKQATVSTQQYLAHPLRASAPPRWILSTPAPMTTSPASSCPLPRPSRVTSRTTQAAGSTSTRAISRRAAPSARSTTPTSRT